MHKIGGVTAQFCVKFRTFPIEVDSIISLLYNIFMLYPEITDYTGCNRNL